MYGFESFVCDIVEECPAEELDSKEKYYIAEYRRNYGEDKIYNVCTGGLGGKTHDITGINNPMYGKHQTAEMRQHLSNMLSGRKKPDGFGAKVSAALKGRPKKPEAVAKRSHPIKVYDMKTGEVLRFKSKAEMERTLHCNTATIMNGGISHNRYKLFVLEGVETTESPPCVGGS